MRAYSVSYYQVITLFSLLASSVCLAEVSYKTIESDDNLQKINITLSLAQQELIYADSLTLETDHPSLAITSIQITPPAVAHYDPASRETKKFYEHGVTIGATVQKTNPYNADEAYLHITYTTNQQAFPIEKLIPLTFKKPEILGTLQEKAPLLKKTPHKPLPAKKEPQSLSGLISRLLKTSNSLSLQLLLALLLGILLSLTPCIYPMIPITVGILHNYGTKSFFGNTIRSALYAMGMATTYALFGLLASCTGPLCGYLLVNPLFVYALVAFLAYLAGSMLGLYELYIPRFIQTQQQTLQAHSLWSVFFFGLASGAIASPCVSPGLALILGVVATLGSKMLGFLLLFFFGIGLSMPLLIVGTFSSSLHLMPRAGQWMVEVKKFFGFLLLGLCIYYLSNTVSQNIIFLISALTIAAAGVLYLYWAQKIRSKSWKQSYNFLGVCLIGASVLFFMKAAQETWYPYKEEYGSWQTDIDFALASAQHEKKLVFIDVWAQFCSICIAINNSLLADPHVLKTFEQYYVIVKVDGTSATSEPYAQLQKRYAITGFPTFLIIDPDTQEVIKQWDSALYAMPKEKFIEKITQYASNLAQK